MSKPTDDEVEADFDKMAERYGFSPSDGVATTSHELGYRSGYAAGLKAARVKAKKGKKK